jgi:trehalose 6-phosphate phosphatase
VAPAPDLVTTATDLPVSFAPLLAAPRRCAFALDFDGTISSFVDDPAQARPAPGAAAAVAALAEHLALVAVVSGRPVAFLAPHFPPEVTISGLYGLEERRGGVVGEHPQAGAWREVIADVASLATARAPAGVRVESKGVSLTLHYREHPEIAAEVHHWATAQAGRAGLTVRDARLSVELHPPIAADKGTALQALAAEVADLAVMAYAGDDLGDLPAYDALDRLEAEGRTVLRVAVHNAEPTPPLVARADVQVADPPAMAALIRRLAQRLS